MRDEGKDKSIRILAEIHIPHSLILRSETRDFSRERRTQRIFMTQRPVPHCEQRSCISLQGNPCFPFQPPEDMSLRNVVHA